MLRLSVERRERAGQALAGSHLTFVQAMHDEGYIIVPRAGRPGLIAETRPASSTGADVKQLIAAAPGRVAAAPTLRDCRLAHRD